MRLIDAADAFTVLTAYYHHRTDEMHNSLREALDRVPTIDPVMNGKWTYDDECNTGIYAICSACGESVYQCGEWLYCPRCGAKMERSEDD